MASGKELALAFVLSVVDKATAPLAKVGKAFEAVGKAGAAMGQAAAGMRVARENIDDFTGRMRAGLESVMAPAAEVETALAHVTASAGAMGGDLGGTLDALKSSALAWQGAHLQSASTFIATSDRMIKTGIGTAAALKATETALRTSTAVSKDASAVAETLTVVYGQMGDKTKDAGAEFDRFGDVLTRASQIFNGLDVAALSDPLKDALPAAKAAGLSFEQVVAVLGQLNASGIKGGEAGAAFAGVLGQMDAASQKLGFTIVKNAKGQTDLVATLAAMEKKFGSLKDMSPEMAAKMAEAFGPAFKGVSALLGNTNQLSDALNKVQNSAGAAADAQAKLEGTTAAQMQIAQQRIDALKVEIAGALVPAVQSLIPPFQSVVTWVSNLAKEHPGIVKWVGTLAVLAVAAGTVLGPIMSLGGALLSAGSAAVTAAGWIFGTMIPALISGAASAWAFAVALLANPITWIVLAVIALAAVIYIYWEPISKFFLELWDKVKVYFVAAWSVITSLWEKVTGFFTGAWAEIKGAFQESFVKGVFTVLKYLNPLTYLTKIWGAILPFLWDLFSRIPQLVWSGLSAAAAAVAGVFSFIWNDIKAGFDKGLIEGLKNLFGKWTPIGWIVKAWTAVFDWLGGLEAQLFTYLSGIWDSIVASVSEFFSFFSTGIQNDIASVTGFFTGLWDRIVAAVDGGLGSVLALIASFSPLTYIVQAWDAVAQWLFGFSLVDAGRNIVNTIVEGIKSVASAPFDAMTDVVQKVRNLLPFSPAKEGPFRDLHKVKIVETVADGIKPAPMVDAMTGAASAAMDAIGAVPPPPAEPASSSWASPSGQIAREAGGAPGGGTGPISITIQLGGGDAGPVSELEQWLADPANARRILVAAQRAAQLESLSELE